jgi:LmbE family N-acetylglucosaminyl deacetylase
MALVCMLFLIPETAAAQHKTVVILAPHPDDEALCCSGVIYNALQQGSTVKIVVVTNGDYYSHGTRLGIERESESVTAMGNLGLSAPDIIFMGYGDQTLQSLYESTSPATIITSRAGQSETYAKQGLGGVSYHEYLHGAPGPYNRETVLQDMKAMLRNLQPDEIYTTSLWDDHPDHRATFNFVVEALLGLKRQGVLLSPRVHETIIHCPCSSCGVPDDKHYQWPGAGRKVEPVFNPAEPFPEPYYLSSMTPYEWDRIESIPVPAPMRDSNQDANLKARVISRYTSQEGRIPASWLFAFARKNEWFWIRDFSANIAGLATVSVSSENGETGQLGSSSVDGFIEGFPGYGPWEWATQGELDGAWIKLTWPSPMTISQIVLYNRMNGVDDVLSGTLHFSDGSSVPVGQLPMNGNGLPVSFEPKTVTWMQFTVDSAVGQNIGLTEIEAFGELAGSTANHPQIIRGPEPSVPLQTDKYGQALMASITDVQTTDLSVTAFDVDEQSLDYSWTADSGSISGTGPNVVFSPPVVAARTVVTVTVTVSDGKGGTTQNSTFVTVTASDSAAIVVSSLVLNPATVKSGGSTIGTVTLNAAAPDGAIVSLSSARPTIAAVPQTVTIAPGARKASFPINTARTDSSTAVAISATLGGATRTVSLECTASPRRPPPPYPCINADARESSRCVRRQAPLP